MTEKPVTASQPQNTFYGDMKSFDDFSEVADLSRYQPAPADWLVVIADIQGSTQAIHEGRYKDVNMVGAATITAVLNVTKSYEIPYVFGGDGATLMIPPQALETVSQALLKTRDFAQSEFGLTLRVGTVPVHRVRKDKMDVLVAKYKLSPGNYLAVFAGGGVGHVDKLIKEDDGTQGYLISDDTAGEALDLEGLSCRWEPLAATRGVMLSMLIQALSDDREEAAMAYGAVMARVNEALGFQLEKNRPIKASNLRFSWPPKGLKAEARATCGTKSYFNRLCYLYGECFVQLVLETFHLKLGGYNSPVYREEMRVNSDYRRFDDTLRMVLDVSRDDVSQIEIILSQFRDSGDIAFGLHEADSALMTCLVFNLDESEHVHFIDGGDGGFAVAAKQLKAQLRALNE